MLSKTPLPRHWRGLPGLSDAPFVGELKLTRGSRVALKVIVFETPRKLRKFWKDALGKGDLGKGCLGAVNSLCCHVIRPDGSQFVEYDPRWFAVMGLCKDHLTMEIITHESAHAAFSYVRRVKHRNPWFELEQLDEEYYCYPIGRIASALTRVLRAEKLI